MSGGYDPAYIQHALKQLAVFMDLYEDEVFDAFLKMLEAYEKAPDQLGESMARFTGLLYRKGTDRWADYLEEIILKADTCLARTAVIENDYASTMFNTAMSELTDLALAGALAPRNLLSGAPSLWIAEHKNMQGRYLDRLMNMERYGTGLFSTARMFRLGQGKTLNLIPVRHHDPVTFDELYGYDEQHQRIIDNTRALLNGLPCSNLLLYGDAGTGKSASIKAVANMFGDEGLRLIEVPREQLDLLPELLERLSEEFLHFILYIDDLSFGENDETFSALKAVLEGSVCARSSNVVIYTTSNRRHLVKESMSARTGDDVHRRDTLQETLSLSQRFGQCVFFEKPNANSYLELVDSIAAEFGYVPKNSARFHTDAMAYSIAQGGRSARAARQFVESCVAKEGLKDVNA